MHQQDINNDLGHYLHDRKKEQSSWTKIFGRKPRPKEEVQEEIKDDLEQQAVTEQIAPAEKKELEQMEQKIEEVNAVEEKVEEDIEEEHEGLLKKFFKKLNFSKEEPSEERPAEAVVDEELTEEQMKDFLKSMHSWITQLPPETLKEFKASKDFELYTKVLRKYNLIK